MDIKKQIIQSNTILQEHINKYAVLGLIFSVLTIILASMLVSWQLVGRVTFEGIIRAQMTNPALWFLDITPFVFAYWGQKFFDGLISKTKNIIATERESLENKSEQLEHKLSYISNYDEVTGLHNYRSFIQFLNETIAEQDSSNPFLLCVVTLKNIKEISYLHGDFHLQKLIRKYTQVLKKQAQKSLETDSYRISMIARLNSDEFIILIKDLSDISNATDILNKLRTSLNFKTVINGETVRLNVVLGATIWPNPHAKDTESLVNQAITSSFHAQKHASEYAIYNEEMLHDYQQRPLIVSEIKKAIEEQSISVYYEPTIDFISGKIIGAEALARLENEIFGTLTADDFISLIEGTSFMKDLSLIVLEASIQKLAKWIQINPDIYVTVTLSAGDAENEELPQIISNLLTKYNVKTSALHLAFTEKSFLENQAKSILVLKKLAKIGIIISIDDFCSGYSSFVYLTNFPIQEIKIDKSFVHYMLRDHRKLKMVRAIIELARIFDLTVSAEGIENEEIYQCLLEIGCLQGKGRYFFDAVSMTQFTNLLIQHSQNKDTGSIN